MSFSKNSLTQFYWIAFIVLIASFLTADNNSSIQIFLVILFSLSIGFSIRSITSKVIIKEQTITFRNLFTEKSIYITPESKIYIKRDVQSVNFIFRHYDYSVTVVNPNETLSINTNVNNADKLYGLISELEQKIILPVLYKHYKNNHRLILDQYLSINPSGIQYKGREYLYTYLTGIEFKNGHFNLLAEGKLWQTTVFSLAVSDIPNLNTFITLVHSEFL